MILTDLVLLITLVGVDDLEQKVIRSIGDPQVRLREDPVRILRAIKFAARFGFHVESETDRAMRELPEELLKASRFRVTEEVFRILTQKHRDIGFRLLCEYGLMETLYPHWCEAVGAEGIEQVEHFFEQVESAAISRSLFAARGCCCGLVLALA